MAAESEFSVRRLGPEVYAARRCAVNCGLAPQQWFAAATSRHSLNAVAKRD
jgi:hypothetical protein